MGESWQVHQALQSKRTYAVKKKWREIGFQENPPK